MAAAKQRAFLGTGLLGAAMAEHALGRGDAVRVWNRTRAKAEALVSLGARVADTPAEAVRGLSRVHLVLTHDAAIEAVLAGLAGALEPEVVLIDHSTTSPEATVARAARLAGEGIAYLHAPVFMSPQACRQAQGTMVVAGPRAAYEAVAAELAAMTGRVQYVGEELRRAGTCKLLGNAFILAMLGGIADAFAIAEAQGVSRAEALELLNGLDPRFVLRGRGAWMAAEAYEPAWTLQVAHKDLRLMLAAVGERPLAALPGIGARLQALADDGHANRDVGILARREELR